MFFLNRQSPESSAVQPGDQRVRLVRAVLQCLHRAGWLVNPLLNGARVSVLNKTCKHALEGWPRQLEYLHTRHAAVISVFRQKREKWIQDPDDILPRETVSTILNQWKNDYESWMNSASQERVLRVSARTRHDYLRVTFRAYMFKMAGDMQLARFWLHVKPSWCSLRIFTEMRTQNTRTKWMIVDAVEAVAANGPSSCLQQMLVVVNNLYCTEQFAEG